MCSSQADHLPDKDHFYQNDEMIDETSKGKAYEITQNRKWRKMTMDYLVKYGET